ncbi:NAD(P)H-quinone oxidoreductase chain 4 [Nymphaea thermarum]|nr:NAD(P)H-quinone oxidoreductase chain 4 [Nymphaea thermarum]
MWGLELIHVYLLLSMWGGKKHLYSATKFILYIAESSIFLLMGVLGLVPVNMELLPHAHSIFSSWLMILGTIQIIYAALTSLGQRNLKKRIAYSFVSHMSFIIIGISSITDAGLNGAILQIVSHGFIGAALFS